MTLSFILLENNGILPLKKEEKVAFVGPLTEEKNIIGAWSIFGEAKDAVSVLLYIRDDCGSVARPVRELRGFEKIWLEPGEEKGNFTVFIGSDSDTDNQKKYE